MKHFSAFPVLLLSGSALMGVAQAPAAHPAARPAAHPAAPAASSAAAAEPTKIAVIGFQAAVSQTNEFKRNFADLEKKWSPKREELRKLNDDIEASTKALQTDGAKLSDAERASRARAIDDKKKQLDRSAEDAQNDFQEALQQVYSGTATKVYDVLSNYAKQNGYTLVLDVAGQQTPILYAVQSTDITQAIVDAYNVKSGVPAPPPSAPTPAGAAPSAPAPSGTTPSAPKPASPGPSQH